MFELFLNPAYLLAGTALISLPILIHLINRMRFKRIRWAAMEFLLKSQKRNRRRLIIEQLLLLFLRCLLVALVTLLVSRFAGFSFAQSQTKDSMVIALVDDTLSMNDNWKEASNAAEIQVTLPPPDDHESAIITTLAPSNAGYTAVVRGVNNSTGVALVEVYGLN